MLKNIKLLRKEAGVSQKELGENIGASQQSINKYENYNIEPDIETLIRIANFFNTSVDFIVGNTDIRHKIEAVSPYELNEEESQLVDGYRKLTPKQKDCIATVVSSYEE